MNVAGLPLALLLMLTAAQAPLPVPPTTPYGAPIGIDDAKRVAAAAIAEAKRIGANDAIAVVDSAGYLVYFERLTNTQLGSVELAIEKARTSALFRRPTKVFEDAVAGGGDGLRVLRLTGAIPNEGGVPIVVDGKIVGAIGVSGASVAQDGRVANTGAAALK